jgi:glycosyltransferase involved in cell wall biosynthesis
MEHRRGSVLWVNQFALLPRDGGGTRHFEIGRELVRRGWKVTIVASDFHLHRRSYTRRAGVSDRRVIREVVEGVEVLWVWVAPYQTNNWRRAWNWITFGREVRRAVAMQGRIDIVIGSSPQLLAASASRGIARHRRVPFLLEIRDLWPESLLAAGGRKGVAYYLMERLAWSLYRSAERIVILANGTGAYLMERGVPARKLIYVPNGVDVGMVQRSQMQVGDESEFRLIYAGAHGPANGLEEVLDAAQICESDPGVRFTLIGDGPSKLALIEEARRRRLKNVEFLDAVPKESLVQLFEQSHAGLMVLRNAPLFAFGVSPNKLFDYLAAELPVVCNVPGEVASLLSQAGGGVQTRDSSGAALAESVLMLRSLSGAQRASMGSYGREWVRRSHSREVLADRLEGALSEVLNSSLQK